MSGEITALEIVTLKVLVVQRFQKYLRDVVFYILN